MFALATLRLTLSSLRARHVLGGIATAQGRPGVPGCYHNSLVHVHLVLTIFLFLVLGLGLGCGPQQPAAAKRQQLQPA